MSRIRTPNAIRDAALEASLRRHLNGSTIGQPIYAFHRVSSTMDEAHRLAIGGASEGTLVWASRQEQGRGRQGRVWKSPSGGLYCSVILRPSSPPSDTPQLSLVAGLAVAEAIRELTSLTPTIRWPNDVLLDGKKVCGILVEAKESAVIVGIGINVTTALEELPETATTLSTALPKSKTRHTTFPFKLTAALCCHFQSWYDAWTHKGFAPIRHALRPWMGHFGQPVHVTIGPERIHGIAMDLDETGRLLVRLDTGLLHAFDMGEVTLLR